MNFFEAQDKARRRTGWLVVLFVLAVLGLIALTNLLLLAVLAYQQTGMLTFSFAILQQYFDWQLVIGVALIIILFVLAGSLYKIMSLSHGGASVAEMLGGRRVPRSTTDTAERRLLNVVEEMAIASGISVPQVYLMDEMGINAFAAGTTPNNAVIGITTGALKHLKRDELQGVIAHEFSHIFNGDMQLNIRLLGILHGILLLGMTGYQLLRIVRFVGRSRSSKGSGQAAVVLLVLGTGLVVIGYVGFFFGQWIKAMVSRQREYLADASAVRYTRNQRGIAGALKKIGGMGSILINPAAVEYSHAYFSKGVEGALEFVFATHPPLDKRIRSIEPNWNGKFIIPHIPEPTPRTDDPIAAEDRQVKLTNVILAGAVARSALSGDDLIARVGTVTDEQMAMAHAIIESIPDGLRQAASEPFSARAVIYGLLMDWRAAVQIEQQDILKHQADPAVATLTHRLQGELKELPDYARLPLLEMAIPVLQTLSINQYQQFRSVVQALISADRKVDLKEWVMQRLVIQQLDIHFGLRKPARARHAYLGAVKNEAELLLSLVAYTEHPQEQDASRAFAAAKQAIGTMAYTIVSREELNLTSLNHALDALEQLKPPLKPRIITALAACILHDGKATITGQELLRAVAACLDCPIPPLG